MLTLVGLSLIIATCTCRGHDLPRLRCFCARACASRTLVFLFIFLQHRERGREEEREISSIWNRQLVKAAFRSNFVGYTRRLEAPAACLSHQHAAQPATPRSIQPQTPVRAYFQSRFTESTDGKTFALLAREVAILDSHHQISLP